MVDRLKTLEQEIRNTTITNTAELEAFRLKFISRKGVINQLFQDFKALPQDAKQVVGQPLNHLKQLAHDKFKAMGDEVNRGEDHSSEVDVTLPPVQRARGTVHPLSQTYFRIVEIFERLGFNVALGPEIEDDWYNFSALNFPENHPARQMQDTFFLSANKEKLLRTHTSNVQIRMLCEQPPPVRSVMPGRVYRNEAISARAHCFFHQFEGLFVDKGVSFKDLKDTLYLFAREMFGKDTRVRLRPSYFPFTEPSAEFDISCFICKGEGCKICKQTGWVEIGGSGVIDPNVLTNCGIDASIYSGWAFGMGLERITMLRYRIDDIRLFSENDVRFLRQF